MTKEKTCAELIAVRWESTKADLTGYMDGTTPYEGDSEMGPFNDYAAHFDYVEPNTFTGQIEGYWRYQMMFGGPSDEIRFWCKRGRRGDFFLTRATYVYMDWGDGAEVDVTNEPCIEWLWEVLDERGEVESTYMSAMADYEELEMGEEAGSSQALSHGA